MLRSATAIFLFIAPQVALADVEVAPDGDSLIMDTIQDMTPRQSADVPLMQIPGASVTPNAVASGSDAAPAKALSDLLSIVSPAQAAPADTPPSPLMAVPDTPFPPTYDLTREFEGYYTEPR